MQVLQTYKFALTLATLKRIKKKRPATYAALEKETAPHGVQFSRSTPLRGLFAYLPGKPARMVSVQREYKENLCVLEEDEPIPVVADLCTAEEQKKYTPDRLLYRLFAAQRDGDEEEAEWRIRVAEWPPHAKTHCKSVYWMDHDAKRCFPLCEKEAKQRLGAVVVLLASRAPSASLEKDAALLLETRQRIALLLAEWEEGGGGDGEVGQRFLLLGRRGGSAATQEEEGGSAARGGEKGEEAVQAGKEGREEAQEGKEERRQEKEAGQLQQQRERGELLRQQQQ